MLGAQKNRLDETVLLSTPKHMFKLMDKKVIAILRKLFFLNWPYELFFQDGLLDVMTSWNDRN